MVGLIAAMAVLAVPAMASAASTYNATFTVDLTGLGVYHTFTVQANCSDGAYTGSGESNYTNTDNEAVSGTIATGSFTGHAVYGPGSVPNPYYWDFQLTSGDSGLTYAGTGTSSMGESFVLTGTLISDQATACRNAPAVTSKDQCKKDGWKSVSRADDSPFKNQGDCVSYTQNGK